MNPRSRPTYSLDEVRRSPDVVYNNRDVGAAVAERVVPHRAA